MKKVLLYLFSISLVICITFVLNNCKKSQQDANEQQISYYYDKSKEIRPDSKAVIPLILQFKTMCKNIDNGLKTYEDMPLYQALWTLESTVNYDYASDKDSTENFTSDSIRVYIDSYLNQENELMLDGACLSQAYQNLFDFIYSQLNSGGNNILIVGDLVVVNAGVPVTTFQLNTITAISSPFDLGIDETDYWFAANENGKCGPYVGQNVGWDASDRINQVLNWNHGIQLACGNGGTLFYTSIEYIEISEGPNGWYFWNGPSPLDCLDPTDMNYWVDVAEDEIEAHRPPGKVFIDVNFFDDLWMPTSWWVHRIDPVRYGIPNCTGTPD